MWLGEKRPTGSREFQISQLLGGNHVGDPAKHGEKQSQKTEERLILPTLTQLTAWQDSMENSHQGNELSNHTEWEKWTLNDDDVDAHSFSPRDFNVECWHIYILVLLTYKNISNSKLSLPSWASEINGCLPAHSTLALSKRASGYIVECTFGSLRDQWNSASYA